MFNEGALFSAGDGHGVQGDGEVCINALEMCLTGHFRLSLEKGGGADPVLKSARRDRTHYISMGMHEDLDLAMKQALREMIAFICSPAPTCQRRRRLPVLLAGGGFPRHPDGERRKGRARDAEEGPAVLNAAAGRGATRPARGPAPPCQPRRRAQLLLAARRARHTRLPFLRLRSAARQALLRRARLHRLCPRARPPRGRRLIQPRAQASPARARLAARRHRAVRAAGPVRRRRAASPSPSSARRSAA
jgi:hypothetical protein